MPPYVEAENGLRKAYMQKYVPNAAAMHQAESAHEPKAAPDCEVLADSRTAIVVQRSELGLGASYDSTTEQTADLLSIALIER